MRKGTCPEEGTFECSRTLLQYDYLSPALDSTHTQQSALQTSDADARGKVSCHVHGKVVSFGSPPELSKSKTLAHSAGFSSKCRIA